MKKSSLDKLSFFFLGLVSRFKENEIIFEDLVAHGYAQLIEQHPEIDFTEV